ncbi:MAG TPA: hypothetical protein VLB68_24815 [Pyrinomonadaceae bacterium]|nr:hypothetical protein [Pyrinomonadaceae bacterium]
MSESILTARTGIFPCPSCGQMIYSDVKSCRFCSAKIDFQVASRGADIQLRVNTACNQAKMLRNSAGAMWIFVLLGLIPFLPFGWGATFLFFAIPAWLVYWQVKFGRLQTSDVDYKRAKRDRLIALGMWLPALGLELLSLIRLLVSEF